MKTTTGPEEKQLSLFDIVPEKSPEASAIKGSVFSDPAFASNKSLPIHRWVPWIAGFSSDFVKQALRTYLNGEGPVLDPFAGVGTTLVEAVLSGYNAIGFEINPYAAMACRVKLEASCVDRNILKTEILKLGYFYRDKFSSGFVPKTMPPEGFRTRADFYSPKVLYKVLIIQDFIATIQDHSIKDIFMLVFAATMVSYSNYSYEPSLARRVSSGKQEIIDFPVFDIFTAKLTEILQDITWFQTKIIDDKVSGLMIYEYQSR